MRGNFTRPALEVEGAKEAHREITLHFGSQATAVVPSVQEAI